MTDTPNAKGPRRPLLIGTAALAVAAALAFFKYRAARSRGAQAPVPPGTPRVENDALHWPGSTIAGVGARSDARERL
jgi:hypothetical protein